MKKRLISAIIALIIVVPLFILGGIYFKLLISFLGILAIKEVLDTNKSIPILIRFISYIVTFLLIFLDHNIIEKVLIIISIYLILLVILNNKDYNIETSTFLIAFDILIVVVFSYICIIRVADINALIYLLMITILTDTFAYIGGRLFGKHKLIERISPNKTIEGSIIGSLIGTVIPTIFYIYMISPGINVIKIVIITLVLSIVGQFGDLVFSSIKRHFKIKDFSNIMPGHGGILDRLDSIIFVIIGYVILMNIL